MPKPDINVFRRNLAESGWESESIEFYCSKWGDRRLFRTFRKFLGVKLPRKISRVKKSIPPGLRKRVFERDTYRCQKCGTWLDLSVDHIFPEALGGTSEFDNLQTLCRPCNLRKGTKVNR